MKLEKVNKINEILFKMESYDNPFKVPELNNDEICNITTYFRKDFRNLMRNNPKDIDNSLLIILRKYRNFILTKAGSNQIFKYGRISKKYLLEFYVNNIEEAIKYNKPIYVSKKRRIN